MPMKKVRVIWSSKKIARSEEKNCFYCIKVVVISFNIKSVYSSIDWKSTYFLKITHLKSLEVQWFLKPQPYVQSLKLHLLPLLILAILNPLYIHVRARKVMLLIKATENETINFIKRKSKKRIQFIEDMKLRGTK